jgi:hypothetical protein
MPLLSLRLLEDDDHAVRRQVQVLNESGEVLGVLPALTAEYSVHPRQGMGLLRIEVQAQGNVDVRTK